MHIFHWIVNIIKRLKKALPSFKKSEPELNVLHPILNSDGSYIFYCPGCEVTHLISTTPKKGTYHTLTGTLAKPTIRASILVSGNKKTGIHRCHAYITEGVIEYLDDCTHSLANKTVSLEPL